MEKYHRFIQHKLDQAADSNHLRKLKNPDWEKVDFFSNDYLGFSTRGLLQKVLAELKPSSPHWAGATGSRLISGNHPEITQLEADFAQFLSSPNALLFNTGYLANVGLLSALGDKDSAFVYDEHVHASIKEGMRLGFGAKVSFKHNSLADLEKKLQLMSPKAQRVYVITEGLFSMHGDTPPIDGILTLCEKHQAALIIDEAHTLGTLGEDKKGLSFAYKNHPHLLARIITFGKSAGCHGGMVLGQEQLIQFLINYSRAFIYTTAPSYDQVRSLQAALRLFQNQTNYSALDQTIRTYEKLIADKGSHFSRNPGPIQAWSCPDIPKLKAKAQKAQDCGFNVYPILSPTVKQGEERVRIILHAFNTKEEIIQLIQLLEEDHER